MVEVERDKEEEVVEAEVSQDANAEILKLCGGALTHHDNLPDQA